MKKVSKSKNTDSFVISELETEDQLLAQLQLPQKNTTLKLVFPLRDAICINLGLQQTLTSISC